MKKHILFAFVYSIVLVSHVSAMQNQEVISINEQPVSQIPQPEIAAPAEQQDIPADTQTQTDIPARAQIIFTSKLNPQKKHHVHKHDG